MELAFLDSTSQREVALRIERARGPLDVALQNRLSEITSDWAGRGLLHSTAYLTEWWAAIIESRREVAALAREEIMRLVEAKRIRLRPRDVGVIGNSIAAPFRASVESRFAELLQKSKDMGLGSIDWEPLRARAATVVHGEAVAAVEIRVAELRRARGSNRRKWWSERLEKAAWALIGVVGTLMTQFLIKRFR